MHDAAPVLVQLAGKAGAVPGVDLHRTLLHLSATRLQEAAQAAPPTVNARVTCAPEAKSPWWQPVDGMNPATWELQLQGAKAWQALGATLHLRNARKR